MFSKLAVIFTAIALVAAAPGDPAVFPSVTTSTTTTNINKCNVGTLQCCKSVQNAQSAGARSQAGLLGIQLGDITGQLGFQCTPISAIVGVGNGANCNANPVCCEKSGFNGLIQLGCDSGNINV